MTTGDMNYTDRLTVKGDRNMKVGNNDETINPD